MTKPLALGEFLRWLGIWLLLSTIGEYSRDEFWSEKEIDRRSGAPYRFNDLMSGRRFSEILQSIIYTDREPPTYNDRFWEVRQMIKSWNDNMKEKFMDA